MMNWSRYPVDGKSWGMMGGWGGIPYAAELHYILSLITWLALIGVLVALARWLWKKGGKQ